jgi:hypothetical protein
MDYSKIYLILKFYGERKDLTIYRTLNMYLVAEDIPDLRAFHRSDDFIDYIGFFKGPNWNELNTKTKIAFFEHRNYQGNKLVFRCDELKEGIYLKGEYNFADKISSIKFPYLETVKPLPSINRISLVLELFSDDALRGDKFVAIANIKDLNWFDTGFGDKASSVRIHKGPSYKPGDKVTLYEHEDFKGKAIFLGPGEYVDLKQYGMGDKISSIKFP